MAHDVFLTYSKNDKTTAQSACAALERSGIRVWMAPRDVVPGADWPASIIGAINRSRAMVLIFSRHANSSQQVKREVERAVNKGIPVIPFRIEDVAPSDSLEYLISAPHWLDAFTPDLEEHLARLASAAKGASGGRGPAHWRRTPRDAAAVVSVAASGNRSPRSGQVAMGVGCHDCGRRRTRVMVAVLDARHRDGPAQSH
jgi:hypothetical protein